MLNAQAVNKHEVCVMVYVDVVHVQSCELSCITDLLSIMVKFNTCTLSLHAAINIECETPFTLVTSAEYNLTSGSALHGQCYAAILKLDSLIKLQDLDEV